MALSDEQIVDIAAAQQLYNRTLPAIRFARAIEAEVRKDYEELIRQMLDALEQSHATLWEEDDDPERPASAAITAARERLGDEPTKAQPAIHPATVAACIARLEQGGQSAAVSILRHHFEQKGG